MSSAAHASNWELALAKPITSVLVFALTTGIKGSKNMYRLCTSERASGVRTTKTIILEQRVLVLELSVGMKCFLIRAVR